MNFFILLFIILLPEISFYIPPAPLLLLLLLIRRDNKDKNIRFHEDKEADNYTSCIIEDFIFNTGFDKDTCNSEPILNIKTGNITEIPQTGEGIDTFDKIDLTDKKIIPVEKIIHDKFEGCTIDALLSGGSAVEGEVIFDFDGIVTIKNVDGVYYINSKAINIFK